MANLLRDAYGFPGGVTRESPWCQRPPDWLHNSAGRPVWIREDRPTSRATWSPAIGVRFTGFTPFGTVQRSCTELAADKPVIYAFNTHLPLPTPVAVPDPYPQPPTDWLIPPITSDVRMVQTWYFIYPFDTHVSNSNTWSRPANSDARQWNYVYTSQDMPTSYPDSITNHTGPVIPVGSFFQANYMYELFFRLCVRQVNAQTPDVAMTFNNFRAWLPQYFDLFVHYGNYTSSQSAADHITKTPRTGIPSINLVPNSQDVFLPAMDLRLDFWDSVDGYWTCGMNTSDKLHRMNAFTGSCGRSYTGGIFGNGGEDGDHFEFTDGFGSSFEATQLHVDLQPVCEYNNIHWKTGLGTTALSITPPAGTSGNTHQQRVASFIEALRVRHGGLGDEQDLAILKTCYRWSLFLNLGHVEPVSGTLYDKWETVR